MLPEPLKSAWLPLPEAVLLVITEELLFEELDVLLAMVLVEVALLELLVVEELAVEAATVFKAAWVAAAASDCSWANWLCKATNSSL